MPSRQKNMIKKDGGFTLVEVLIALIILSVGMLGIAGLYVQHAGRTYVDVPPPRGNARW